MTQNDTLIPSILADTPSSGAVAAGAGMSATILLFFETSLEKMLPYLFISLIVILLDLWFGIQAAKTRKEEVRWSRAIRRTLGKAFEYFCWAVLASSISVATGYDMIQTALMLVVIGIECVSIFQNWLTVKKGKKVTVDLPKVVESVISDKLGADVRGAIILEDLNNNSDVEKDTNMAAEDI
ncbi:MAG: phage holin family protein [Bacteroidales bacterium]|nr:phage holin family protein [Bacteroidales bacterium]